MGQTLAQALRPFPQFGSISDNMAPLGNSWYDSLQAKLTKRFSHGLNLQSAFTWQKELTTAEGGPINDVFNRANQKDISQYSLPFVSATSFTYQIPFDSLTQNKVSQERGRRLDNGRSDAVSKRVPHSGALLEQRSQLRLASRRLLHYIRQPRGGAKPLSRSTSTVITSTPTKPSY